jgi:hypothetical protein
MARVLSSLIDFYVQARLNSTETSLQLSENIPLFAVCRISFIYIYMLYNVGDRTEPCGNSAYIYIYICWRTYFTCDRGPINFL